MAYSMQLKENEEDSWKASISRFLGEFERRCKRLEKKNNDWKTAGLVVNACASLAGRKTTLRGITIDASIWAGEVGVSVRVGLYKLRRHGKDVKRYFLQDIQMIKGDGFGWADKWGGFARDFSGDTDMAVIDYGEMQVVKEAILDFSVVGRELALTAGSNGTSSSMMERERWWSMTSRDFQRMLSTCSLIMSTGT